MRNLLLSIAISVVWSSNAQTILLNEDFSSGIPSTFAVIDADGQTPNAQVSQFTDGFIWYESADDSSAASTSYFTNDTVPAEDYLILPQLGLLTVTKLSWEARSVDPSFPENYYVLLSTTDSLINSFTDTLLTVIEEDYQWNRKSILLDTMGFANQNVFIAFRNFTTDGFILEIDDILVEASDFVSITENEFQLEVFPNPTTDNIQMNITDLDFVEILSTTGQTVLTSNSTTIDVSLLKAGTYIVRAVTDQQTYQTTFIKK